MADIKNHLRTQVTFRANGRLVSVIVAGPVELSGDRRKWGKEIGEMLSAQGDGIAKQISTQLLT